MSPVQGMASASNGVVGLDVVEDSMTSRPIRVLIADDDDAMREVLAEIIRAEPSLELTDSVADAAQAILAATRDQPGVAVLDVRMPGGGAHAARGIKRHSPGTRLLALSIEKNCDTVVEMLEAGADGYLVKNSSIETIVSSIQRAAAGQGVLSNEVTGGVIEHLARQLHERGPGPERLREREQRIRRVLDGGVLRAVYQPICTLEGAIVGAEALARFRDQPAFGPEWWFAEAREVGLSCELELLAAEAALAGLERLPAGAYLTVNVSPATLVTPAFLDLIAGSDGARLVIEVTEHARVDNYGTLREALAACRSFGARLAVDDAGAGFASLHHILQLEPEFVKLDRTLIAGIDDDRSRQALAVGLISFADKIGATIIAEGIEQAVEVETLEALGVRYGQGYFFARPGPLPLTARTYSRRQAAA